jgi:hypothetical protein
MGVSDPHFSFKAGFYYFTKNYPVKYLIQVCICAALFSACHSSTTSNTATTDSTVVKKTTDINYPLLGVFKGDFDGKPIYITVNYAQNGHIAGYNIVNGLRRNLSGNFQFTNNGYEVFLSEPGDHPFDGKFAMHLDNDAQKGTSIWTPLNTTTLKEKSFSLEKVKKESLDPNDNFIDFDLAGDHRDITFGKDGSVVLNYYDMRPDSSSYAEQMNTITGTWEKKGDSITVIWQKKTDQPLPATVYYIVLEKDADNPDQPGYFSSITSKDSIPYYAEP